MAAKRRLIVSEDFDLGDGSTTIPTDSGGTRAATKVNLSTIGGNSTNYIEINQPTTKRGILINGAGTHAPLQVYGTDRGDGTLYEFMLSAGTIPALRMNTSITLNGASGSPPPISIAGQSSYMLGIGSDVGASPTIVVKTSTGPFINAYDSSDLLRFQISATGFMYILGDGTTTPALELDGSTAAPLEFNDSSQSANNKKFRIVNNSQSLYFQASNDARNSFTTGMSIGRTGGVIVYNGVTPTTDNTNALGATAARFSDILTVLAAIGLPTNRLGDFYVGSNSAVTAYLDAAVAGSSPFMIFRRSEGTQASRSNVANADVLGVILAQAYCGATGFWDTAQIVFYVDGVVTDNQRPPSSIIFRTNAANTAVVNSWTMPPGGGLSTSEITDRDAPQPNNVIIYARDTGGKTELVARFNTGAIQQIAIEP